MKGEAAKRINARVAELRRQLSELLSTRRRLSLGRPEPPLTGRGRFHAKIRAQGEDSVGPEVPQNKRSGERTGCRRVEGGEGGGLQGEELGGGGQRTGE